MCRLRSASVMLMSLTSRSRDTTTGGDMRESIVDGKYVDAQNSCKCLGSFGTRRLLRRISADEIFACRQSPKAIGAIFISNCSSAETSALRFSSHERWRWRRHLRSHSRFGPQMLPKCGFFTCRLISTGFSALTVIFGKSFLYCSNLAASATGSPFCRGNGDPSALGTCSSAG